VVKHRQRTCQPVYFQDYKPLLMQISSTERGDFSPEYLAASRCFATHILGEEEVIGGQRWYHSKEQWWLPTDSPLWPMHYLPPFGRNSSSNVSDDFRDERVTNVSQILTSSGRDVWLPYAKETGLITSAIWPQCTNVTDRQTDNGITTSTAINEISYQRRRIKIHRVIAFTVA